MERACDKDYLSARVGGALGYLAKVIYMDAVAHGLWDDPTVALDNPNGMKYVRRRCTLLIREEVAEACEDAGSAEKYAEELADVIIMTMSTAGHLGINIADAILQKIAVNHERPYKHGKELSACTTCRTK